MTFATCDPRRGRVLSQSMNTRFRLLARFGASVFGAAVCTVLACVAIAHLGPWWVPAETWTLRIATKDGKKCAVPTRAANGPSQEAEVEAKHLPLCDHRVIE